MLLLSTGLTWGTFCSNDSMLISGMRMTVPVTCAETSARTFPGLAPFTTTTGMLVAASRPAGTSRVPEDFSPGAAEAVPTVNLDCAETHTQLDDTRNATARMERWR